MATAPDVHSEALKARCAAATCRGCDRHGLTPVLDLGLMPLTSAFLSATQLDDPEPRYPLEVAFCESCTLLQIVETVPPAQMFRADYPYFSSYSTAWLAHCKGLARQLMSMQALGEQSFVVELASNDGCLLRNFVENRIPCLGVDPAAAPVAVARTMGVNTICEFFDLEVARRIRAEHAPANFVIGMNVLAHVAALHSFLDGVHYLLADDGEAVFEFPYARDLVERSEFDTVYHEHLCYFSATSVAKVLERHGLFLNRAERQPVHGGSLRVFAGKRAAPDGEVEALLAEEAAVGMWSLEFYDRLRRDAESLQRELSDLLRRLHAEGKRIVAYGAAAKGAILLNYAGVDRSIIEYAVDLNVHKQGLYLPGVRLPVHAPSRLLEDQPDYILILPWNIADEIIKQESQYAARGGKFIIPIPELCVVGG